MNNLPDNCPVSAPLTAQMASARSLRFSAYSSSLGICHQMRHKSMNTDEVYTFAHPRLRHLFISVRPKNTANILVLDGILGAYPLF